MYCAHEEEEEQIQVVDLSGFSSSNESTLRTTTKFYYLPTPKYLFTNRQTDNATTIGTDVSRTIRIVRLEQAS